MSRGVGEWYLLTFPFPLNVRIVEDTDNSSTHEYKYLALVLIPIGIRVQFTYCSFIVNCFRAHRLFKNCRTVDELFLFYFVVVEHVQLSTFSHQIVLNVSTDPPPHHPPPRDQSTNKAATHNMILQFQQLT